MTNTQDTWPAGMTATMNVTYTQANAAGGAIVCEISPGAGNEFIVMAYQAKNSGTNGIAVLIEPATASSVVIIGLLNSVASGAGTIANGPPVGSIGTGSNGLMQAAPPFGVIVSGTQALRIYQTGAGAQNDTFQVLINIRTRGAMPTVSHANSTNPANVTATAGAESFVTV